MEVRSDDIILFSLVFLMGAGALVSLPKLWRDEFEPFKQSPPGWIWSKRGWEACKRIVPSSIFLLLWMSIGFLLLVISDTRLVGAIAGGVFVILSLFMITIPLFNRPKFLVAPPLRGEKGLWWQWREDGFTPPERRKK